MLIAGLVQLRTTARIGNFPVGHNAGQYPVYGVDTQVTGSGYSVAKAMKTLGNSVNLTAFIGHDPLGLLVRSVLDSQGIDTQFLVPDLEETPQSVVFYDDSGKSQAYFDYKNVHQLSFPPEILMRASHECSLCALCDVRLTRHFLPILQKTALPIAINLELNVATDELACADIIDAAHILFVSHEMLPCSPEQWVRRIRDAHGAEIVVVSLGSNGALIWVRSDNFIERIAAAQVREVVSTEGADNALFAAFIHCFLAKDDPYEALEKALLFSSHKVGEASPSEGFLDEAGLDALRDHLRGSVVPT